LRPLRVRNTYRNESDLNDTEAFRRSILGSGRLEHLGTI
jgi:hypothetical protein